MREGCVRILVFLFTDIEGSTRLWEEHAGVMAGVIARHDVILRELVEAYGGFPLACALQAQMDRRGTRERAQAAFEKMSISRYAVVAKDRLEALEAAQ